jgi:hypothetical protein
VHLWEFSALILIRMVRVPGIRLLFALAVLLACCAPILVSAQDDPNEIPLGDVARNLRKNTQISKQVIDDDNLPEVMQRADSRENFGSTLRYLMDGNSKGFQVSAPDVTCSLAFTANAKALLSSTRYSQMDIPAADLAKLEGPAVIEGDALTVSLFNATDWHISEVSVAFTVVKKATADGADANSAIQQVRPEKKPDTVVIYKMRAVAAPWTRAVFSAPLNLDLAPDDEWHWAIVQAKGYPPEHDPPAAAAQTNTPAPAQPVSLSSGPDTGALPARPQ